MPASGPASRYSTGAAGRGGITVDDLTAGARAPCSLSKRLGSSAAEWRRLLLAILLSISLVV